MKTLSMCSSSRQVECVKTCHPFEKRSLRILIAPHSHLVLDLLLNSKQMNMPITQDSSKP